MMMTFSQCLSTFSIALFNGLLPLPDSQIRHFPRPGSQGKLIETKYSRANSFQAEITKRMAELGLGAGS